MDVSSANDALVKKIRGVLKSGRKLAVVGWMEKNHNPFTKQLTKSGRVWFSEPGVSLLPQNTGFILFTKFVSHAEEDRLLKSTGHPESTRRNPGEIRRILKACEDLLMLEKAPPSITPIFPVAVEIPIEAERREGEEAMERTIKISKEEAAWLLADAFFEETHSDPDACLISRQVTGLVQRVLGDRAPQVRTLAAWGVFEPVRGASGSRVSGYKAGPRLLEVKTRPEGSPAAPIPAPSEDPIAVLRQLVAKESDLLRQKAELEKELERVSRAKRLLQELEELTRSP